MIPPPIQNTVGVYNQIILLFFYYVSSRPVTVLKIINASLQVSDVFDRTVSFKFVNFSFQIFLLFFPEMSNSFTFYIVRLSTLLWFGSCNHCILACFVWSKNREHSLPKHGLCFFNSHRPRLSSAEVLIFSLMFSQALSMYSLSLKFSKAANLFQILIWYCFLTSSSFYLLRLNLPPSNLFAAGLRTASLSKLLHPPASVQYHSQLP
jgi:hypothetical protein